MQTLAERLADYAVSLNYDSLPEEVIHEAKRRIIDSIGCSIGAFNATPSRIVREALKSIKGDKNATVIGSLDEISVDMATFVNGTMVRYLDFNDTYLSKEPAHPSDNIPAALAVAEAYGKTGKEVILGTVLGYEIQCRLADAATLRKKGWDHVTYGAFSSAILASRIIGLDKERITNAINMAGVCNIALRQTRAGTISMWKACAFANVARNGVFAAILAEHGMTGPSPIFEGQMGFWNQVSGEFELKELGGMDGAKFKILDTGIKFYPAEYHSQTSIEIALDLRKYVKDIREIEEINVETFDAAVEIIGSGEEKWNPTTRETADHSLPYIVAVALADGDIWMDQFDEKRIRDEKLLDLVKKVKVKENKDCTKLYPQAIPSIIEIKTKRGERWSKRLDYPRGHAKNPMSDKEVEKKFTRLAEPYIGKAGVDSILSELWNLERVKDLTALIRLTKIQ